MDYIIKNDLKVDLVILNAVFSPDHFNYFLEPVLRKQFDCDVIHYENEHHLSHAILAFQRSDFEESLVCVIDRNGSTNNYFSEVESILKIDKSLNVNTVYKNFAIPHVEKINFEKDERLQWNLFMNQFLNYSILHGRSIEDYLPSWVQ